jgi:ribosomal-protein-alanine N-acetyltransferase
MTERVPLQHLLAGADAGALPTLPGRRVSLRQLTADDAPAIRAVFGDPEVTRYWVGPTLADEGAARALVVEIAERARTREGFQWGIARRDDDLVIGTCSLYRPDFAHRRSEVGFALGRAHWGRGYAAEALDVVMTYAFERLDLHRLEADVDPRNEPSLRALERAGFRREGYQRERWQVDGELQDSVLLGVLRTEWRPREWRARVDA